MKQVTTLQNLISDVTNLLFYLTALSRMQEPAFSGQQGWAPETG